MCNKRIPEYTGIDIGFHWNPLHRGFAVLRDHRALPPISIDRRRLSTGPVHIARLQYCVMAVAYDHRINVARFCT